LVVRENAGESADSSRLSRAARCGEGAAGGVRDFQAGLLGAESVGERVALDRAIVADPGQKWREADCVDRVGRSL